MPRIADPDIARRMRGQVDFSMQFFGQDATMRKYISASAGVPEAGVGDAWMYQLRPIKIDLRELKLNEIQALGGQAVNGAYHVNTMEQPNLRDEIIYPVNGGTTFRIASEPIQEQIGNILYWGFVMVKSEVTGTY